MTQTASFPDSVYVTDCGFSAGYGVPNEAVESRAIATRFFGHIDNPSGRQFFGLAEAHAAARRAAQMNGARYWIRLSDGSLHIGYADDRER